MKIFLSWWILERNEQLPLEELELGQQRVKELDVEQQAVDVEQQAVEELKLQLVASSRSENI